VDGDRLLAASALTIVAGALMVWQGTLAYLALTDPTWIVNLGGFYAWALIDGVAIVAFGVLLALRPRHRSAIGVWVMALALLGLLGSFGLIFAVVVGLVGGAMAIQLEMSVDPAGNGESREPSALAPGDPPEGPPRWRSPTQRIARG
jgi:hypothetical protein